MEIKNNVLRLNEAELHQLIESAARQALNEGRFGDMAKKAGKGLGKAALAAGLMAGCTGAAIKGLDNQIDYEDRVNREAAEMNCDPERDYIEQHGLDPNDAASWEEAKNNVGDVDPQEYYNETHPQTNGSKKLISDKMIESLVREELKKILG